MKTLIDALCKQLTNLDRQTTECSWSGFAQDARRKFNAVHSTIETYGYIINWSHAGQCFEAEFNTARAELLGIPECVWPEAALEAHEAAKAAAADVIPCPHNRTGWCETCAST